MYSLTFVFALQHPRSMDEMERLTQQARRFCCRRGEFSPACVVCVCCMHAACGGPGGLPLGSATHFHSVAIPIATQPVQRLQIRPMVHNLGASPNTPPSYIRVRAIVWECGRGQTDIHTHTHTNDSREM